MIKVNFFKKHAFTLAEVLVTLGIIGVVSAMTIPALTQNWQKRSYVTQLHKVYSAFQQAFLEEMGDKNALNLSEAGVSCGYYGMSTEKEFLHNHFKIVKDCGESNSNCFASSYKSINGHISAAGIGFGGYRVVIAGGAAIAFDMWEFWGNDQNKSNIGRITVDINGQKGPNIAGRDLFVMVIYPDGSLDDWSVPINCRKNGTNCGSGGSATATRNNNFNNWCKSSTNGDYCFGKILNDNWEMNY